MGTAELWCRREREATKGGDYEIRAAASCVPPGSLVWIATAAGGSASCLPPPRRLIATGGGGHCRRPPVGWGGWWLMGGSDGGALFHSFRLRTHGAPSLIPSVFRLCVRVCECVLRPFLYCNTDGPISAIDFSSHSRGACDPGCSPLPARFSF